MMKPTDTEGSRPMTDPTPGETADSASEPEASDADKIAGILDQTRGDYEGDDPRIIADRLRQRFEQSQIDVGDDRLAELVEELRER
jgi:hypothetical protein